MVEGMTEAPIPWPGFHCKRGRHKGLMPILFDGLVRAVVEEDEVVVAHYLGRDPLHGQRVEAGLGRLRRLQCCVHGPGDQASRSRLSQEVRLSAGLIAGSGLLVSSWLASVRLQAFQVAAPTRPIPHPLSPIAIRAA